MKDWKERLVEEQAELKDKFLKLTNFINSEEFYTLSDNNKQLLKNQKVVMELYLTTLNMRLFEDIDKIAVPDLGMIQLMGGIFGNTWNKALTPIPNNDKPLEEINTTGIDKTPVVS